jgi:PTS system fructose-specific IIC component
MRITDLLKKEGIELNGPSATKEETISHMVELMSATGNINDPEGYKAALMKREEEGTTGIGEGIAIPHGKTAAVDRAGLACMVCKDGTEFDAMDGQPAKLIFAIAVPNDADNTHLEMLSRLSMMLMDEKFREALIACDDKDEFLKIIDAEETEKFGDEELDIPEEPEKKGYDLLAVTACPTGIAHTYMAAESLEEKAKKMGYTIKVETNGSGGIKNKLTPEEIEGAKGIIVAADKKVEMDRFDGKHVLITKVADGINKPEELIKDALAQKGAVYHAAEGASAEGAEDEGGEKESVGRKIYKDLMNGVSHMLPFVIGGGIMMALSFLIDAGNIGSSFGTGTPVAAFFNQVGNGAFAFMLPVLAGFIAMSIADRPGLAVGFVGGWLAKEGIRIGYYHGKMALLYSGLDPKLSLVSAGFLGAMAAGFIAGYLVLGLKKLCSHMPESLEGIKPMLIYPFVGVLLIGLIMVLINWPLSALNQVLYSALESMGNGSKVVLGLIVGGMMAIDMGGPFNKAAYLFGTGMLASGNYDIMAAVMIGGMVPPLGIALATTIFKNRFTKRERQSGISCYVMGLSFITEGAIPFAASDPGHVIPSCVAGSAVAGALSMLFNCTLRAPHGGIFVFPVVGHWPMYLLALLIGSVITMALLGILKKPLSPEESGLAK